MEYHWTSESYLAQSYCFLNPSLDDHGRELQQATIHEDAQDFPQLMRPSAPGGAPLCTSRTVAQGETQG